MSYDIRHFLVFVEQDRSVGRPLPDESISLPFSSSIEKHFLERCAQDLW